MTSLLYDIILIVLRSFSHSLILVVLDSEMAYTSQSSPGFSATQPDTPAPSSETNSIPPPLISTGPSRFPPKFQQDQMPSPSIRTPAAASPANGVKTGSPIPHLSTPPGPPVFSSPIRPAAVPFRTSPASPQPVVFSSASSLPASTPPHFLNTSTGLQHQISDVSEDSTSVAESSNVLFSSQKVLLSLFFFL